jgi:ABC-type Zn uptake system ZnuABC Zn-binding protein ZnuA
VSPEPCATPEGSGDVDGEGSGPSVEGVRTDPEATDTDGRPIGPAATTDACPAGVDPHVWLDADRAASMVDLLAVELGARTPLDEVLLRQRAEAYVGQIRVADERAQELLAEVPAAERILVTTVPALAYFARRHDLQLVLLADDPASVGPELSEAVAATGASSAFVSAEVLDALDAAPEVEPGKAATLVVVRTDGIATINSATDGYVGYLEQLNDEVATALAR